MNLFTGIVLIITGLSCGIAVAAGIFAFITSIGVVVRLASKTKTNRHIMLYEDMVLLGGVIGNLIFLYNINIPVSSIVLGISGVFIGIFTGCLAIALAEVLNVFPILISRVRLKVGLSLIVLSLGLGKTIGALFHLF